MTKKFLIGIVAAAAMVSCIKKTEVVTPSLETGTATIKGQIKVNSDMTNDTVNLHLNLDQELRTAWENEAGIEVVATIDLRDLDSRDHNSKGEEVVKTTCDADGNWELTVRTPKNGSIGVDIEYQDVLVTDITANVDSVNGGTFEDYTVTGFSVPASDDSDWLNASDGATHIVETVYYQMNNR